MRRKRIAFAVQLCVLFIVCVLSATIGAALRRTGGSAGNAGRLSLVPQSDEKVIEVKEFSNKPFEISDLSVKEVNILPGQKFNVRTVAESEGWLDNLRFNIKNKWDKQIIFIKIDLEFPETLAPGRPLMKDKLDIGIHPQATGNAKRFGKPLALNPGEKFTYTLSEQWLTQIKRFLEQGGFQLANLNKAVIRISNIFFDDGTAWAEGDWYRHNPNNSTAPGGYERIKQ